VSTGSPPIDAAAPSPLLLEPKSPDQEAVIRLRLAAAVSLIAELILPLYETIFLPRPDWLAILIQAIWFVLTVTLLAATWHPRFARVWKPVLLLFATCLIFSSGYLSIKGALPAPFLFLLVLLPVGGACLPWDTGWQTGMSALCVVFGSAFASQLEWHSGLVISGLSAMVASILGSHLVNAAMTRQRTRIDTYLKALTRSEAKFRKIFETSASILAIFSVPDGLVVDVNPAWEKTFGISRAESIGQNPIELGLVLDRARYEAWLSSLEMGDAGAFQDPVVYRGRRQDPIHCVYSWSTLELNDRFCILMVGQDITERVQAEEELRRNREAMANQERLTAVGELASGIAHDLNNSLNALRLNVELLQDEQNVPPDYRDRLSLLSRMVSDANSTIGRLQDFARRRHDRPVKAIDLATIIRQSVEMARSTLEEKSALLGRSTSVEVSLPHLPLILGEPAELRQIFLNLLLNAQDAMARGGAIRIAGKLNSDTVAVTIEDEGQGIPQEFLDRVFDPFFTTKGERGTGLGLSIAYGAMARLGGSITAGNRPCGGAIFTLRFPLAPQAAAVSAPPRLPRMIQPRRVMVIDDDADNLEALSALFKSRGHSVKAATSGAGALSELMREDCTVEVVFCDLGMPEINGWDIARQVKSRAAPPVFYLFTGWAQEIRADDPRRRWVDAVVPKPVEPRVLDQLLAGVNAGAEL
jgi:PAS domain S-box-containing protein